MPKVTALQFHTYDGKAYQVGDTYEAADAYVETLLAMQFVALAEAAAPAPVSPAPEPAPVPPATEPDAPRPRKK